MLEERRYLERVLIVLAPDGSLKGAAGYDLAEIVKDGAVVQALQGEARPLAGGELAGVLPTHEQMLATVTRLAAERDALARQCRSLTKPRVSDVDLAGRGMTNPTVEVER